MATGRRADAARPLWVPALELALLLLAAGLLGSTALQLAAAAREQGAWPLALGAPLGVIAADLASGLVHWFCDHFLSPRTPLLGRLLIAPFREHHRDPQAIVAHGWLELHGNSALPVIGILLAARHALPSPAHRGWLALHSALLCLALAALATNQFHVWAHMDSPPAGVRRLQRLGVILSGERHARHHRGSFAQSYCMTTGWLNPLLDRSDFFGRLEAGIRRVQRWAR